MNSFIDENIKKNKGSTLSYRTILPSALFDSPGPGEYEDVKKAIRVGRGISIGKESKFFHTKQQEREHKDMPGPGDFTPMLSYVAPLGPSITIPKAAPEQKTEELPGPGHYEPFAESSSKQRPGFKFGREIKGEKEGDQLFVPGPGDYNSHVFPGFFKSHIGFPAEKARGPDKPSEVPGPGRYYKEPEKDGGFR